MSAEVHDRPLRSRTLRGYLAGYRGKRYGGIFLPSLKDLDMSDIVTQRRTRQLKGQLTDLNLRNLSTRDRPYKVADGNGLYVLVSPTGLRAWRWKYRFASREKVLPLGSYPDVSLAQARTARDAARTKVLLIRTIGRLLSANIRGAVARLSLALRSLPLRARKDFQYSRIHSPHGEA